ncbi:MAG: sigma-70 family RNA polymerase sigma factor [Bryobacterales bacterium]|nr:sigma-70 family RNA polymerase sigma factor [Acidobacteriota bacterium]MCB9383976.1 sigma-70 family RNA polymerase sigma factor [Bryobacterales bacterium]
MSSDFAAAYEYARPVTRSGEGRRPMSEAEFQVFYAQTCRPLRAYLRRSTGNAETVDDLLQEAYFRFLRVPNPPEDPDARRGYLFRIGANLVRDHFRASGRNREVQHDSAEAEASGHDSGLRADLGQALESLEPKDRTRLWLAYVNGSSHREIAEATGVKEASVRPLLLRARRKLADLLRRRGFSAPGGNR